MAARTSGKHLSNTIRFAVDRPGASRPDRSLLMVRDVPCVVVSDNVPGLPTRLATRAVFTGANAVSVGGNPLLHGVASTASPTLFIVLASPNVPWCKLRAQPAPTPLD